MIVQTNAMSVKPLMALLIVIVDNAIAEPVV